jgi:hypothetical protein
MVQVVVVDLQLLEVPLLEICLAWVEMGLTLLLGLGYLTR